VKIQLINATPQQVAGDHTIHLSYRKDSKNEDIQDKVSFVDGVADCDENAAQWLIDNKLAAKFGAKSKEAEDADDAAAKAAADADAKAKAKA
jgi:hypothetical protein